MAKKAEDSGSPKFPYTTEPKALRRLLTEIPKRPKPPKLDMAKLRAWDVSKNNNAMTAVKVLKRLGLLTEGAAPNDVYVEFMKTGTGPVVLGGLIRQLYRPFFESSHAPHNEPDDELKKLFHIHSGGGEDAMRLQVLTFKALADHANFADAESTVMPNATTPAVGSRDVSQSAALPPVQVDLHIHLPENKTSREYETIIQDIAKYIYGRQIDRN